MPLIAALCKSLGVPIVTRHRDDVVKGLQTSCASIATRPSAYWTSLSVLDCSNTIVLGSAGAEDNLHFYKDEGLEDALACPRFQRGLIDMPTDNLCQSIASEKFSDPVHSLASYEETLLVGSNHGFVKMLDVHGMTNDTQQPIVPRQIAQYVPPGSNYDPLATPGIPIANSHVKAVQFSRRYAFNPDECYPVNTLKFFMVIGSAVHIWDVEHQAEPIYSRKFGPYPLNNGHWSPHAPYSLIATASTDGSVNIIDNRISPSSAPVWTSTPRAHRPGVRDVKFSPMIPYWLASADDDGVTQIWDIRFSHAVAEIDGHRKPVNSLAWGNMHAEIICTASSDPTFKMWSLTPGSIPIHNAYNSFVDVEDEYSPKFICSGAEGIGQWSNKDSNISFVGEFRDPCLSPVVQIRPSQHWRNLFYCITSNGQLSALNVRRNTRESIVPHRYDVEKDPIAFDIEKDVFGREMDRALENLELLKSTPNPDERKPLVVRTLAIIRDLEEIMTFTPPIDPSTWELGSLPKLDKHQARLWSINDIQQAGLETYEAELIHWTRYMPPGLTRPYLDQHLPKSLVKVVPEFQHSPPEPIEEAMVSENSSMFESVFEEPLVSYPTATTFFSASSQIDPGDTQPAKPKHHWKPALNSIRRTMSLNKRSNKVEARSASADDTSTLLSRKSTRRHGLY
ncbi:WD40-repeat-containing domain protein [Umbelopsis sp. AD052]|nr:WD40-repeat-containing domain protein [Umbelopsis sp. AD052]